MNVAPIIESAAIQHRVQELAVEIAAEYADKSLVMVGVLNGAARFMMDLLTALPETVSDGVDYDFIGAASYAGHESTGRVDITLETAVELQDRHVLVVDGIADSGLDPAASVAIRGGSITTVRQDLRAAGQAVPAAARNRARLHRL